MDAQRVAADLLARLNELGIGHEVEFIAGAAASGVQVRSPYADPVTVVEHEGNFQLVTRAADGSAKLVDTELSASGSVELLALYLAFHSLWAMKRTLDLHTIPVVATRMPELLTHQQLALAFIAAAVPSDDADVAGYATSLLGSAAAMLRG